MNIKQLVDHLSIPQRQTEGSAGYDLNCATADFQLNVGERRLVETGFAWEIPKGMVGLVRIRSGHAVKKGLEVMAGTIDSDYRGEVKVMLVNHGDKPVVIRIGERIAQMLVVAYYGAELVVVDELSNSERGNSGFGSSGDGVKL